MCCDGADHPLWNREHKKYTCCGKDKVLEENYDKECCHDKKIDPLQKDEKCPISRPRPGHNNRGISDKEMNTDEPSKWTRSFPPRIIANRCSGQMYDLTKEWCFGHKVVPVKDIKPGKCDDRADVVASPRRILHQQIGSSISKGKVTKKGSTWLLPEVTPAKVFEP
jgi:hypothetical protein